MLYCDENVHFIAPPLIKKYFFIRLVLILRYFSNMLFVKKETGSMQISFFLNLVKSNLKLVTLNIGTSCSQTPHRVDTYVAATPRHWA